MRNFKFLFWFNALFLIIFGIFLLFKPELALKTIILIIGIECIISGLTSSILLFRQKNFKGNYAFIISSIVQAIFGLFLVIFPDFGKKILQIIIIILGIGVIIKGILMCINSFNAKKLLVGDWRWLLILGISLIVLGIILITHSFVTILTINMVIGLCSLAGGIILAIQGFRLGKAKKQINGVAKEIKKGLDEGKTIEIEKTEIKK